MTQPKKLETGVPVICFLYTNIGRGHPFYLDGIIEALIRKKHLGLVRHETDVFDVSRGSAALGWKLARWLYRRGSSSGIINKLYTGLRRDQDYNRASGMLKRIGRDIRREFMEDDRPLIVAHPSLVGILNAKRELLYQHGELVTPRESLVQGAATVFVPTLEAATAFADRGYGPDQVVVTGLCLEPGLVRQATDAFEARRERFIASRRLTGAFFSSGAEPTEHLHKIAAAVVSATKLGGRAVVFARQGGRLYSNVTKALSKTSIAHMCVDSRDMIPSEQPPVLVVSFTSRREENLLTAYLFPQFDYLVAPAHERTNWALGLGLPMFVLEPTVGPFAPLNRELLLRSEVAESLQTKLEAHLFGTRLDRLHQRGYLMQMAQAGWEKRAIDGFAKIADFLVNKYGERP